MGDQSYLLNGRGLLALAIPETKQYPISTFHLPEKHVETDATTECNFFYRKKLLFLSISKHCKISDFLGINEFILTPIF